MSSIDAAFKDEIARVARRQLRSEIVPLIKSNGRYRSEIAALKRRLAVVERQLRAMDLLRRRLDEVERQQRALGRRRSEAAQTQVEEGNGEDAGSKRRFSAKGLANHRKRLGLSASQLARLLGVTALSVYHWESGKTKPRAKQVEAIAAIRTMGRREAVARLEALGQPKSRKVARAAVSRAAA